MFLSSIDRACRLHNHPCKNPFTRALPSGKYFFDNKSTFLYDHIPLSQLDDAQDKHHCRTRLGSLLISSA